MGKNDDSDITENPLAAVDSDSDGDDGGAAEKAAKQEEKKRKAAEKKEYAKSLAEAKKAAKENADPILMALLHSIRCLLIMFALLLGIASALVFSVLLIAVLGTAEVKATASSVIIEPAGDPVSSPASADSTSCTDTRFLVQGERDSCFEVGGRDVVANCIPDEPMQWQLDKEHWVCVDYMYSDPESLVSLDDVTIYCLDTEASKETKDDTQFWDCELPCPTPGQMMEKDNTITDPDPEASVEGFGDYGFTFNRNACLQCMACTTGYTDCSEPSAQYYHIEAMPPLFLVQAIGDAVEPNNPYYDGARDGNPKSLENSNAAYDGTLTDRYTDKIKVRIDTIYHAGEHRSDDYARL